MALDLIDMVQIRDRTPGGHLRVLGGLRPFGLSTLKNF